MSRRPSSRGTGWQEWSLRDTVRTNLEGVRSSGRCEGPESGICSLHPRVCCGNSSSSGGVGRTVLGGEWSQRCQGRGNLLDSRLFCFRWNQSPARKYTPRLDIRLHGPNCWLKSAEATKQPSSCKQSGLMSLALELRIAVQDLASGKASGLRFHGPGVHCGDLSLCLGSICCNGGFLPRHTCYLP